ncbi:MAG: SGNH/GDSL hydrolase family protein [Bacilli bacterium]|nr:SGNH/GDSL hydrolase family protein [Bacilli bacterium]
MKKLFYVIVSLMFFVLVFLFLYFGFYVGKIYNEKLVLNNNPNRDLFNNKIENIVHNKVIIVGDSRMAYLNERGKKISIPINFNFIAYSGTKISWLKNEAYLRLKEKLDNIDNNYHYSVVVNMGVNDLNDDIEPKTHASMYYDFYKFLALEYPNVDFYFLSVNPIDDNVINNYGVKQYRTTEKILEFNNIMYSNILDDNIKNLTYCDSYNNIDFGIPDGLHYDKNTDQKIINYIVNKCVKYDKRG